MRKADIEAADEIYKTAKSDAEIEIALLKDKIVAVREESMSDGKIIATGCNITFNRLLRYAEFYKVKKAKEHRIHGKTWDEFCSAHGEDRRRVDEILNDLKPIYDNFTAEIGGFLGIPFSKIRYLGRSLPPDSGGFEEGHLLIDGQKIPLTPENKDEIEAAIDAMKEASAARIEDKDATLKAKDKILQAKDRVIQKQEKEIQRYERTVKERGFEPGEEKFIKTMENLKFSVQGALLRLETWVVPDDATVFMKVAYMETIGFIARAAATLYGEAMDNIGMQADVTMQELDEKTPKWTQPEV